MEELKLRRKTDCPRCGSGGALTPRQDFYGWYLACLVCGWNGETDDHGFPVMVDVPPPPIKRRRRRRRKKADGESEEMASDASQREEAARAG